MGNPAHLERALQSIGTVKRNHHALEHLDPLLAALDDAHMNAHRVTNFDLGAALAATVQDLKQICHVTPRESEP